MRRLEDFEVGRRCPLVREDVIVVFLHAASLRSVVQQDRPLALDLLRELLLHRPDGVLAPKAVAERLLLELPPGLQQHDGLLFGVHLQLTQRCQSPVVDLARPGHAVHLPDRRAVLGKLLDVLLAHLLDRGGVFSLLFGRQDRQRHALHLGVRHPHLDVLRLLQQALVESARVCPAALGNLVVDVRLPHGLRHVELFLRDGNLVKRPGPLRLPERRLELGPLPPRRGRCRVELQKLLVERPATVDVPQGQLHLDVAPEKLILRTHPDGHPEDLPRRVESALPDLKLGRQHPHLGKREGRVRDQLETRPVYFSRPLCVSGDQLLEQRVLDPQVHVPLPEALFRDRRHRRHGHLVGVAHLRVVNVASHRRARAIALRGGGRLLLEPRQVEPQVVVPRVLLQPALVLFPPLGEDRILDPVSVAALPLERQILPLRQRRLLPLERLHRELVDRRRPLPLPEHLLKLSELHIQVRRHIVRAQLLQRTLIYRPCHVRVAVLHLELGVPHVRLDRRDAPHVLLVDLPRALHLAVSHLHLDIGRPAVVVGLPLHPSLVHLPRTSHVAQHLFHVDVFLPQLVYPRQNGHRTVPHVPRVVHKSPFHLHLCVSDPEIHVPTVHLERPLPDGPGPTKVVLRRLPGRVLEPDPGVPSPHTPNVVLKLLPLGLAVLGQLLWVGQLDLRRLEGRLDQRLCLPHDLLHRDLRGRRGLVLDRDWLCVRHRGGRGVGKFVGFVRMQTGFESRMASRGAQRDAAR